MERARELALQALHWGLIALAFAACVVLWPFAFAHQKLWGWLTGAAA